MFKESMKLLGLF